LGGGFPNKRDENREGISEPVVWFFFVFFGGGGGWGGGLGFGRLKKTSFPPPPPPPPPPFPFVNVCIFPNSKLTTRHEQKVECLEKNYFIFAITQQN